MMDAVEIEPHGLPIGCATVIVVAAAVNVTHKVSAKENETSRRRMWAKMFV